jgi:uncharacterized protein YndB with AHSA1/START domain
MEIARSVEIGRGIEDVFALVSDARQDPRWCPKVRSVEQVAGDGPGPDARYRVVHKPVPGKPEREMDMRCTGWSPPHRIEWLEDDGTDVFRVTYELDDLGDRGTRLTQRSDAQIGAPRLLHPVFRAGIGRDINRQLKELRRLLEG